MSKANPLFKEHRITSRKYMGDDEYSWAVFVAGRPMMTGLSKPEVLYYKRQLLQFILDKKK